ncbi:MAG TPA: BON domain-containing protein [Bdellovibrionota bacterium]|jgi:hypothetical protein
MGRYESNPRSRKFFPRIPEDEDDFYYGGAHAQREDWPSRAFDNNPRDREEGMYDAGGRDFSERMRDTYGYLEEGNWYGRRRPNWTGGDRGWEERMQHRGLLRSVRNFFGVGPKGYKRSDERIREDVCEALARHPEIDASDIEVVVKGGRVTLAGTVPDRWMRRQAEDAVEFVSGVEDVRLDLNVIQQTQRREGRRRVQ